MQKKKFKNILLVGHSLGAYGCLKAATPEIQTIILLGGMVGPVHFTWEQFCTPQEITEMEKVGYATLHDPHPGPRLLQQWKQEFCQHVATINQKDLMASVTCPVLFIHGSKDIFPELEENAHKALMYLKPESKITIIPDASHEFMEHIPQVTKEISGWLKEKAPITYHP